MSALCCSGIGMTRRERFILYLYIISPFKNGLTVSCFSPFPLGQGNKVEDISVKGGGY